MAKNDLELLTYENNTDAPTARRFIRDGIAGNYEVVYEMVRVIRNSNKDNRVKNIAAELLLERHLTSYSDSERVLRVIFDYVKNNVSYIQDVAGSVESIKGAYRTISDRFGDCDDLTVTLCSLASVLGFENVNIALAKYSKSDESFSHVYSVVYANGQRFPLDASIPYAEFGQEIKPYEVKEINVFSEIQGIDGLSGIWTNTRYLGRKTAKAALGAIPNLAYYMPLGFFSSSALATGATLLNQTNKRTKSLSETATAINKELDSLIQKLVHNQIALDLAQSQAVQYVAQFSLIDDISNQEDYNVIKKSINDKLLFIKNFEQIAEQYGFTVTYLNPNAMLLLGAGAAGYGAYKLYQYFTKG